LFEADLNLAAEILLPLFTEIWEQIKIPLDCIKVVIIRIPKKGALSDCSKVNGEGQQCYLFQENVSARSSFSA